MELIIKYIQMYKRNYEENYMIPNATKKQINKAIALLNAELAKEEQNLEQVYRNAAFKAHPLQGGERKVFNIIKVISEAFIGVADHGKKATELEKLRFSYILEQLPDETQDLIINKILKQQPELTRENLLSPDVYMLRASYAHYAFDQTEGRSHAFAVDGANFKDLKDQFKASKGDFLKSQIIHDFAIQIENVGSKEELNDLKKQLESSPEYSVLKTGQGIFTKITGIKTTSQVTVEEMFAEKGRNLEHLARDRKP